MFSHSGDQGLKLINLRHGIYSPDTLLLRQALATSLAVPACSTRSLRCARRLSSTAWAFWTRGSKLTPLRIWGLLRQRVRLGEGRSRQKVASRCVAEQMGLPAMCGLTHVLLRRGSRMRGLLVILISVSARANAPHPCSHSSRCGREQCSLPA